MSKRIICWVGDAPNHRALVAKIAMQYDVVGVVIDSKKKLRKKTTLKELWEKIISKIRFGSIDKAWSSMQQYYNERFPGWPATSLLRVDTINSPEVAEFTRQLKADLIIVSGTSLVKEPLISLAPSLGIMNLHTGLSPYVKGGPNCTNWCIAHNEWGLIGNTIMWLSAGIDSGNIITSERTDLTNEKDLAAIHLKVMEHAHDLYGRAINYVLHAEPPHVSIPQSSLGKGTLYLTKMWTTAKKKKLLQQLGSTRNTEVPVIKTVQLPG